jgi:cellulose biosynthesis protein BcsQ
MNIIALFNNKGGVGKTTLVYHLAHMFSRLSEVVLAVDLDPQSNLTSMFFDEEKLEVLWEDPEPGETIFSCIKPIIDGTGDYTQPRPIEIDDNLFVLSGDLKLGLFEDNLSVDWPGTFQGQPRALRTTTAFYRIIKSCAEKVKANIVLVDIGPNLGAINRAALLSSDYVIVPLAADLFSLQGLKNLGPTLQRWRENWKTIKNNYKQTDIELPDGLMKNLGYIIQQHALRMDRPVLSYEKWMQRIPNVYWEYITKYENLSHEISFKLDLYCLALLRNYRSLVPMAQEARKPIFDLKPADGAIGSHIRLVKEAYRDYESLAQKILSKLKFLGASLEIKGLPQK